MNNSPSKKTPLSLLSMALTTSLAIVFLGMTIPAMAADDFDVEVTIAKKGEVQENQVAFVPFAGDAAISSIILSDLHTTSLKVTADNLPQKAHSSSDLAGTYAAWESLGIPYLVIGSTSTDRGNTVVTFEVINIATKQVLRGTQRISGNDPRKVAHKTAAKIYEIITGKKSDFDAKIAYILQQGSGPNSTSSLIVSDADGENPRAIVDKISGLIYSPAASPDGNLLAYSVQMPNNLPYIYLYDLRSNKVTPLVRLKGSNLSPSFSPDGGSILFSSTVDGDADIYRVSTAGGTPQKVFELPYDQFQPSYSPDGKNFVFASDHASPNKPKIYRADFSGNISRVTAANYAANPAYSPDGTKIGYLNGRSAVVMSSGGQNLVNFGTTGIDEAPKFSPSGEKVVYSQGNSNNSTLVIRSLNGGAAITKSVKGAIKSPVWIAAE
ncbi:hypothetical protein [Psychrobacter sp. I-STPA10]|uniref:hypothetical protein n=1 Tax=Psychrobacter sp. I-STPA10 TaxID=2585769 RepID=UPI001E607759|nr:hypothetical protein [Psychrobacter sp. I-STPA10]